MNGYYVADNVTKARVSAEFDTYASAEFLVAQMNLQTIGGRYGVYRNGERVWDEVS